MQYAIFSLPKPSGKLKIVIQIILHIMIYLPRHDGSLSPISFQPNLPPGIGLGDSSYVACFVVMMPRFTTALSRRV
jgi:hypothetical protein